MIAFPLSGDIGCFTIGESGIGVIDECLDGCFVIGVSRIGIEAPCPPRVLPPFQNTINSYLYWEHQDDDDLQSFVAAYNTIAQEFMNWFLLLNLPVYFGTFFEAVVSGLLLDWIAAGVYGMERPVLGEGSISSAGPYDTYAFDTFAYDEGRTSFTVRSLPTTDDVFRRCLTWNLLKGQGKYFSVRWLKRRIMQFLLGTDGIPINVDQTYRISVSFGYQGQLNITLLKWLSRVTSESCFDAFAFDSTPFDYLTVATFDLGPQFEFAQYFKYAVDSGVLEMPFKFTPFVVIQG